MNDREQRRSAADAVRRRVLGDDYVDAQRSDPHPAGAEFQHHLTETAWGVWAREGPLSLRDRSLLVIAIAAALGRNEEMAIHVGAAHAAGVTDEELDELPFQVAAYAGAPAGRQLYLALRRMRATPSSDPAGTAES